MNLPYINQLVSALRTWNVEFAPGLTDAEVERTELRYGFRFPPDLRQLLQCALPISGDFVNWRDDSEEVIRESLDWPLEGMCFDIEASNFWLREWGEKPLYLSEAFRVAKKAVQKAPRLIPILGHRYLPDEPHLAGNPVLSVWQTDIIHYGSELVDYFVNEFRGFCTQEEIEPQELPEMLLLSRPNGVSATPRPIRFWDDVMMRRWEYRNQLLENKPK